MDKYTFTTKLHEVCANDSLRPIMNCIHFMNGFACASDSHIAIRQSLEYHSIITPENLDGKSLHKDNYKAIMGFEICEAVEDGISCKDSDGRTAFFEYFNMNGSSQPDFDKIFIEVKPVKSISFIGFDPVLFYRLSKAIYSFTGQIRAQFTGVDSVILINAIGVENQDALIMPVILEDSLFSSDK